MREQFLPSIGTNLRISTASIQGGRNYMEDEHVIQFVQCPDNGGDMFGYFAIFDGHGGDSAARFAREHLLEEIKAQKGFWSEDDSVVMKAIVNAFICTHGLMWNEVENWPRTRSGFTSTAGTTASVVIIKSGMIYMAHCGDSSIALATEHSKTHYLVPEYVSEDHKPQDPGEIARIRLAGGDVRIKSGIHRVVWKRTRVTPEGNEASGPITRSVEVEEVPFLAVARSLGDLWSYNAEHNSFVVSPEPDTRYLMLDPMRHRCLVLASDGLWNMMKPHEALMEVHRQEKVGNKEHAKHLCNMALNRWTACGVRADNISVICVMIDDPAIFDEDNSSLLENSVNQCNTINATLTPELPTATSCITGCLPGSTVPHGSVLSKRGPCAPVGSPISAAKGITGKCSRFSPAKTTPRRLQSLRLLSPRGTPSKIMRSRALARRSTLRIVQSAVRSSINVDEVASSAVSALRIVSPTIRRVQSPRSRSPIASPNSGSILTTRNQSPCKSDKKVSVSNNCASTQTTQTSTEKQGWTDSDQENNDSCGDKSDACSDSVKSSETKDVERAASDMKGIISVAGADRVASTQSPVKITDMRGQLGSVASRVVSSIWPTDAIDSKCLAASGGVCKTKRLKHKSTNATVLGKGRREAMALGIIGYCKRARGRVRRVYNTRTQLRSRLRVKR